MSHKDPTEVLFEALAQWRKACMAESFRLAKSDLDTLSAQPRQDGAWADLGRHVHGLVHRAGDEEWSNRHFAMRVAEAVHESGLDSGKSDPPSAPVGVEGLHPETADLVRRFAQAIAEKLADAERKYGWDTHWKSPAWMDQCREQLVAHVAKGDPRDVAAYAAFLWAHGEQTALAQQPATVGVEGLQRYRAAANPDGKMQMHKDDSGIWLKLRDVAALAQQPAAVECPHRTRCDCLASCKYGMAGDGALSGPHGEQSGG